jgi:2-dehydro-3-deoxyphosphogluconate aldolase / (4S)-4-hydroxy-2-oxoglutarate aldolase
MSSIEQPAWFRESLTASPVMLVLRGSSAEQTVQTCEIAWASGVTEVEVPIETPAALPALKAAVTLGHSYGRRVGAGTITTHDQLDAAAQAGADYLVSPGLDPQLLRAAAARGLPLLPGIATPSEILAAKNLGLHWVKAFPASVLGEAWFRAIKGPFPDLCLVATGGINGHNAAAFLAAGAAVVGVGQAFNDPEQRAALSMIIGQHRPKSMAGQTTFTHIS